MKFKLVESDREVHFIDDWYGCIATGSGEELFYATNGKSVVVIDKLNEIDVVDSSDFEIWEDVVELDSSYAINTWIKNKSDIEIEISKI